jgi:hypothetical protein
MTFQAVTLGPGETQQFWWNWMRIPAGDPAPFLMAQAYPVPQVSNIDSPNNPPLSVPIACSVDGVQISGINVATEFVGETYDYQYLITVTNKGKEWAKAIVQFGLVPTV